MTKEEFAALLNGREYRDELTKAEAATAKEAGLIIVFGASDDLIEFDGAFRDEGDCYGGGEFQVDNKGLLPDRENIDNDQELGEYFSRKKSAAKITAIWAKDGFSWVYKTDAAHSTFEIFEDGAKYCRGLVIAVVDLPPAALL